jgi:hypothetical protein
VIGTDCIGGYKSNYQRPGPQVCSTDKTDHHDITEILLKVALNTIKQTKQTNSFGLKLS